MAQATTTITLSVTAPTQAAANQKAKLAAVDTVKQHLPSVNRMLAERTPPESPLAIADVDGATNAQLTKWLTMLIRNFIHRSYTDWRASVANATVVEPIRTAAPEFDQPA